MKKQLLNKIWIKITIAIVVLILIIMGLVSYFFTVRQLSVERQEIRNNMGQVAKQIASIRLAETAGWFVYQEWIDNIIASDIGKDLVYIAIFDENNCLAAFGINYNWLDLGDNSYLTREEQIRVVENLANGLVAEESQNDFDHFSVNIRLGRELLGKVDVGFSLVDFNNKFRQRALVNLYLLLLFLLVGIVASVIIGLRITRPINQLSDAMLQVSNGNLENTLAVTSNDETGSLAESYNYMISRLREKNSIEQFTKQLGFTYTLEELGKVITEHIVKSMNASRGTLLIVPSDENVVNACTLYAYPDVNSKNQVIPISPECKALFLEKQAAFDVSQLEHNHQQLVTDTFEHFGFLKNQIFLPLVNQNILLGLVLVTKNAQMQYSQDVLEFLSTLGKQAALALENANLLKEVTEKERLSRELEIAKAVQQRLLPQQDPKIPGLDISGVCISTAEIGGDYYDYFILDEKRIGLAIADVSGKGASAAFYMSEIKGMMSALAYTVKSPKELLLNVNQRLYETIDRKIFATMIYGIIDLKDNSFKFVRAGHNALLIARKQNNNQVEMHIPPGIGLGLADNKTFEMYLNEESVILNKQDTLLFYTDGITEAMNKSYQEYGEDQLVEFLKNSNNKASDTLLKNLLHDVNQFSGDMDQFDDITLIVAKITESI